jgi:hypothetical protein
MPYQHCPTCRLTVHHADSADRVSACPRCGDSLLDEPTASHAGLDPKAVRIVLRKTGGRFQRTAPATQLAARSRPPAAA